MADSRPQRLFLIDAMGYIFRAYHAPMERLRSPKGVPTKVPYLFATMVRRLLKNWQPDFIAVVFDVAKPTFRDALYAAYKAQRPPMPEDLAVQLPSVRRFCEAMRLPILEYEGYEADDIIGALSRQAASEGREVLIVTSDKDMLQLVAPPRLSRGGPTPTGSGTASIQSGPVRVLIPTKDDLLVDEKKVEELLGVPPEKVPDVMALMGDAIDNIPGAKGIGEKGARELILRFGSAEAAVEHAAEVESKRYRAALENYREQVLLSKQLATIATDLPVRVEMEALRRQEPDTVALRQLYVELGFTSLLRELAPRLGGGLAEAADYSTLDSPAALGEFLDSIPAGAEAALWLELAPGEREEEGYGSQVVAIELSLRPGTSSIAQVDEKGAMLAELARWLADPTRPKLVHDPKLVELLVGPVEGLRHATMLYSYLLRPTTANHDFADVVLRHLHVAVSGTPGERGDFLQRLAPVLRAEVEARELVFVYDKIDLPLAPVLARMERHGVRVAPGALQAISAALEAEVRALERRIHELAGVEFNVNSPQQLAEILFDKRNLPMPRKYGGGKARSTAAEVLEELALVDELPRKVIEYREAAKLKSTYADALPKLVDTHTGRLHTRFSQTGTATGRLSSANPNLQNIPIRSELGRQIRAAFVAEPGWKLLSADYSQIELRLLAHFSEDPVLLEAFERGEDIHSRTAQEVFGVAPLRQTPEHRRAAKVINFGILYGLSPFGLGQQLGIDQKEAAQFIAAYFERYRGVKAFLDHQLAEVRKAGFTRTLFGRFRPIPEINSPQANLRNFAERTALNTPLQGTAADLIKLAMIEIDRRLGEQGLRAKMILQVHDELLFEVPEEELEQLKALVKPAMEQVGAAWMGEPARRSPGSDRDVGGPLRVPLVVDVKVGPNWRDML
jgi:DNA polymerase-1